MENVQRVDFYNKWEKMLEEKTTQNFSVLKYSYVHG